MSSPGEVTASLEVFFNAWEAVEKVDGLDRSTCEDFPSLEEDSKKISSLFSFSDHCLQFSKRFQKCDGDLFLISGEIERKITELKAHLAKIAPLLDVHIPAILNAMPREVQDAFSSYKGPKQRRLHKFHQALFFTQSASPRNQALGFYLCLIGHRKNPACIFFAQEAPFLRGGSEMCKRAGNLRALPSHFKKVASARSGRFCPP
jgi:hypothetical protein